MSTVAQIIRQADTLKVTLSESGKGVSELWVSRQRLEDLYKKLILTDLEYALDKKVEQDLWNHAFKNQINILQMQAKDKQNVKRGEHQASLNLFLETASGFYLQLLQQICTTFKLDLPFRRKSASFGIIQEKCLLKNRSSTAKKSSCLYVCQHCLVHLGDIARYRQQVEQAQTYYRHAAYLVPQNGQPYNQLAILEAARGNKLSTVFYYIRSLAVRHPFPVAATNLEKFYVKLTRDIGDDRGKLSLSEVVNTFLQLIAVIHLASDMSKVIALRDRLLSSMASHVTSQSITKTVLMQMIAVTIFTESHLQKNIEPGDCLEIEDVAFTNEEEQYLDIIHGFTLKFLELLLLSTPKQEQRSREFLTLAPIKILLDWLRLNPKILNKPQVADYSLWIGLVKIFNSIQPSGDKESMTDVLRYEDVPLPEDSDLRCFQPIEKAHSNYSFSRLQVEDLTPQDLIQIRCHRIVDNGKWMAQHLAGMKVLNYTTLKSGRVQFSAPNSPAHVNERKSTRQNVAIQAIIQKKEDMEVLSARAAVKQVQLQEENKGTSPKYLLGIPTSEPQFMKHGTIKQSTSPSLQRFPSPGSQHSPSSITVSGKFVSGPSTSPERYGVGMSPSQVPPRFQDRPAPSNHAQVSPSNISIAQQPSPHIASQNVRPPFRQVDSFGSRAQPPLMPSYATAEGLSPAAQHQIRAALMQAPIPGQPFQNMSPTQLLQVMKLANQMMSSAQQQATMSPPKQTVFPQAPGMERVQTPSKQAPQQPPRMPGFPANFPGYPGLMNPMMGRPHVGGLPGHANQHGDGIPTMMRPPYCSFNPRTIQPPTQTVIDTRSGATFQGHAEGTPKPENTGFDRRDCDDPSRKRSSQQRAYSLFSSSPWEVSPLAGSGEAHSLGSSPFSSGSSSIRNSPDSDAVQFSHKPLITGVDVVRHSLPQYGGVAGMQSIWSASNQSPLERLLEQQKQQRHGEPH